MRIGGISSTWLKRSTINLQLTAYLMERISASDIRKKEKEIKGKEIRKEEIRLHLLADNYTYF